MVITYCGNNIFPTIRGIINKYRFILDTCFYVGRSLVKRKMPTNVLSV